MYRVDRMGKESEAKCVFVCVRALLLLFNILRNFQKLKLQKIILLLLFFALPPLY